MKPNIWKKCVPCTFGSWIVGLGTVALMIVGILGLTLPTGLIANILYGVIGIIGLGFLYYQIVPCPRCMKRNLEHGKSKESFADHVQRKTL